MVQTFSKMATCSVISEKLGRKTSMTANIIHEVKSCANGILYSSYGMYILRIRYTLKKSL